MSDRVTWEACPNCQRLAAFGWVEDRLVEFDCPNGCRPTAEQLRRLAHFGWTKLTY